MPPLQGKVCIKIMPLSNKHPEESYTKIVGISKKEKIIQFI